MTPIPTTAQSGGLIEGPSWPLQPLLDACGRTPPALARQVGTSGHSVAAAARHGLTDAQADRWAIAIGSHPLLVWGWAWIDQADHAPGRPAYVRLAAVLRDQIARGDYRPGDRLPTVAALAQRWQVGPKTVMAAIAELRAEGHITAGPREPVVATTIDTDPAGCAVCGRAITPGDEHYPHQPRCALAARDWCECDHAAHPERCPTCAAGVA